MQIRSGVAALGLLLSSALDSALAQECEVFQECMAGMCQAGQCVGVPLNGGECDDFDPCTTNDTCVSGQCHGTPAGGNACDDFNDCTLGDTCMVVEGGTACLGSTFAETGTPCASGCGTCQPFSPIPIPGFPPVCRPAEGMLNQPCTPGEDLGPCYIGRCTALGGQIGFCTPSFKECPDDGNLCTSEFCNFETGDCQSSPLPARLDCFPAECHRCIAETGQCVPNNVGASCDDFNACTASTVCASDGQCVAGAPQQTATPTATTAGGTPTPTSTRAAATHTSTPTRTEGTPVPTATLGPCVGDCDGNGQVLADDLLTGVSVALEQADVSACEELDLNDNQGVEVNELVSGLRSVIRGCVGSAALGR